MGLKGLLIYNMTRGGAAHSAGLHATRLGSRGRVILGDLIIGIGDKAVTNQSDYFRILDFHSIGDTVSVQIQREGRRTQVNVTLQDLNQ